MSESLKNRFENLEEAPSREAWDKIKREIPGSKFNWLALFTVSGSVILGLGLILLLVTSPIDNTKDSSLVINNKEGLNFPSKSQKEITINNSIQENPNNNMEEELSKSSTPKIIDNNTKDKSIGMHNSNSHYLLNESQIQIKEDDKTLLEIQNPFQNQSLKPIINKEEGVKINNSIEKSSIIIEQDTVSSRRQLFIPNAFTPMENENNIFKPSFAKLKSYEMKIFNRSGALLFTSRDIKIGWNGYYKGRLCDMGTYVYVIKCENMDGYSFGEDGVINLIR